MTGVDREIEAKYEILSKMGEGGMGSVYKVRHRVFQDVRVVKTAKYDNNVPDVRTRFIGEAKRGYQFRHPNIASVIDFDVTTDGTAYIVMEFIDGLNLRQVLSVTGKPLDARQVIDIGVQTLGALRYLHERGVVHRDISPENLMLTRDADDKLLVKLIDLGIAKSIEASQNLTIAGKFIGKVLYAAPEQFGGQVDKRSDLYSLGVVLYELLTASLPVRSSSHRAAIAAHLSGDLLSFDETDPRAHVPMDLRAVIMRSLQRDLDRRYQTGEEYAEALKSVDANRKVGKTDTVEISADDITAARPTPAEQLAWEAALAADSPKALDDFLDRYPTSIHASTARSRLEAIEQIEDEDWNEAVRQQSTDGWTRYLEKYPHSPRASRARRRIQKIATDEVEAKAAPTTGGLTVAKPRLPSTDDDLDCIGWTGAERADTAEAWREYLVRFPSSARAGEARQRLAAAEWRKSKERPFGNEITDAATESRIPTLEEPSPSRTKTDTANGSPTRMRWIIATGFLIVLILTGMVFWQKYWQGHSTVTPPTGSVGRGELQSADSEPPPEQAALATGDLVINAFPWGEVKSIKDDVTGTDQLPRNQHLYTPARLSLPPGKYTVTVANPNSGNHATRSVDVIANKITRCEASLDGVGPDDYLTKIQPHQ